MPVAAVQSRRSGSQRRQWPNSLPYMFEPRDYQLPILRAMDGGIKRAVAVWHRRAGKDKTFLNYMIKRMWETVGIYYYFFPTMAQGRKALWEGIDRDGVRYLDHFPKALIADKPNDQEMSIKLKNGSLFRLLGTDRLEVVGPNPIGCAFSEYSLQHPKGWSYIRPILTENGGWAMFNLTPRGHNHGYKLYNMAIANPDWFCEKLTVDDTKAIDQAAIDDERRAGMPEWMVQQEFYCSFEGSQEGSYYGQALQLLHEQGRIKPELGLNASLPVYTIHDPGFHWAVWFFQVVGPDVVFLRCYEEIGKGVEYHAEELRRIGRENHYRYGKHFAPVDMETNNAYRAVAGKSLVEHARANGLDFTILPLERRVVDGIERTRQFLHRCWFNSEDCEIGLNALEDYQAHRIERISTDDRGFFLDTPAENWSVHLADAMRYASMAVRQVDTISGGSELSREELAALSAKYSSPFSVR